MKKIATVTPYLFEDHLIIALDHSWIKVFGNLSFDVTISDGHLRIQSTQKIQ